MKKLFSALLCLWMLLSWALAATAADDFRTIPRSEDISWMSYALYHEGQRIEGSGDSGHVAVPMGSVSKTYTATLILQLAEEGALSLDEPVFHYLPQFTMQDERYRSITVRMLLNHTSGLYGSTLKNSMLYGEASRFHHDQFLSMLSLQRLKHEPGAMASYSNDGYTLLELVIEALAGTSYAAFLQNRILTPLSLEDTCVSGAYQGDIKDIVNCYGSGGLFASADDLARFGDALIKEGTLLTGDSLQAMLQREETPYRAATYEFGLGFDDVSLYPFDALGMQAAVKNGDTLSYHASLVVLPAFGVTAAVMTEGGTSTDCQMMATALIADFLSDHALAAVTYYTDELETGGPVDARECLPYAGLYLSAGAQYLLDITEQGALLTNVYTGKCSAFEYLGEGRFYGDASILTIDEVGGEVYLYRSGLIPFGDKANYAYGDYIGVRRTCGDAMSDAWQHRNGHVYFLCDEDYRSQLYMSPLPRASVYVTDKAPGYVGYMKLCDDVTALSDIALPGAAGRDLSDLSFYSEGETEYCRSQGWTFIDSASVPDLYGGTNSVCTILPNGFSRWFCVGDAAGRTLRVTLAEGQEEGSGMWAVYEANGQLYQHSFLDGGTISLPEDGYIVFAGDIGTVFQITLF